MGLFGKKKPRERPVSNSTRTRVQGRRAPSSYQLRTLWRNSSQRGPVTVDGDLLENMMIWLLYYEMMTPDHESIGMNEVWTDLETSGEWAELQGSNSVEEVVAEESSAEEAEVTEATEDEIQQIESAINTEAANDRNDYEQIDRNHPQTSTPAYEPPAAIEDETTKQSSVSSGWGSGGGGYESYDSGGGDSGGGGGFDD